MEASARSADADRQQMLELVAPDPPLTVAVLFGGCSAAPGLTLTSARTISQLLNASVGHIFLPHSNGIAGSSSPAGGRPASGLPGTGTYQNAERSESESSGRDRGGASTLAAVRAAMEHGLDEKACAELQGVRVQPYFVAGDMSTWAVPPHFLLCNNPMEFAPDLSSCQCFPDPEVRSFGPPFPLLIAGIPGCSTKIQHVHHILDLYAAMFCAPEVRY